MGLLGLFQKWVGLVKEPFAVIFAVRDARVASRQKIAVVVSFILLVFYIINPLDLIPDFVPFGFIDDLIVIPLATYFIERLLPNEVIQESRVKAIARLRPFTLAVDIIGAILLILVVIVITAIIIGVILLVQRIR